MQFAKTLALVLATTALLMSDDWLQQLFTDANRADFELNFALGLLAFNVGLWLSGSRVFVACILALLAGMDLVQLGHISYFGRPLDPWRWAACSPTSTTSTRSPSATSANIVRPALRPAALCRGDGHFRPLDEN